MFSFPMLFIIFDKNDLLRKKKTSHARKQEMEINKNIQLFLFISINVN